MTATRERTTGPDLRAARARRQWRQADVAAAAGLSRERITQIERSAFPSDRDIDRYWGALVVLDHQRVAQEMNDRDGVLPRTAAADDGAVHVRPSG